MTLGNGLEPKPRWAHGFEYAADLSDDFTGARELHVKVVLRAEGPVDLDYSAAQHGRSGDGESRDQKRFEVRAQWLPD